MIKNKAELLKYIINDMLGNEKSNEDKIIKVYEDNYKKAKEILGIKKGKDITGLKNPFDSKDDYKIRQLNKPFEKDCFIDKMINGILKKRKDELKKDELTEDEKFISILNVIENNYSYVTHKNSNNPKISIYEYIKLAYGITTTINAKTIVDGNDFILVSGGITGVQDFIYRTPSIGALKMLRGRSFYLEFIINHSVNELLKEVGLTTCNIMYIGGSSFKLFLKNTKETKEILDKFKTTINEWIYKKYDVTLFFEMEYESFNYFNNDETGNTYEDAETKIDEKTKDNKNKKYSGDQLNNFIKNIKKENRNRTGSSKQCICCKISEDSEKIIKYTNNGEVIFENICTQCLSMYRLGNNLPDKNKKIDNIYVKSFSSPENMEITNMKDEDEYTSIAEIPSNNKKRYSYISFTEKGSNKLKDEKKNEKNILETVTYTVNKYGSFKYNNISIGNYHSSTEENWLSSFEDLLNSDNRIGILRADIDDLGKTFKKSGSFLEKNAKSRQLSLFFKYYINIYCSEYKEYKNTPINLGIDNGSESPPILITYSGGDDLFMVGAVKDIINFSIHLNDKFSKLTNSELTISAGIGIFKPKYPIHKSAEITGLLESKAKKQEGKNSIVLFEYDDEKTTDSRYKEKHRYKWLDFKDEVITKLDKLEEWLHLSKNEKDELFIKGNTFVHNLYRLLCLEDSINLARIAYLIGRNKNEVKDKEFPEKIMCWCTNDKYKKELITALKIIILLNREGK